MFLKSGAYTFWLLCCNAGFNRWSNYASSSTRSTSSKQWPGIYAVSMMPYMGPVGGAPVNTTLIPLTYRIPVYISLIIMRCVLLALFCITCICDQLRLLETVSPYLASCSNVVNLKDRFLLLHMNINPTTVFGRCP